MYASTVEKKMCELNKITVYAIILLPVISLGLLSVYSLTNRMHLNKSIYLKKTKKKSTAKKTKQKQTKRTTLRKKKKKKKKERKRKKNKDIVLFSFCV